MAAGGRVQRSRGQGTERYFPLPGWEGEEDLEGGVEKRMCGYRMLLRRLLSSFSQTTRWCLFLSFLKSGFEEASLELEHSISV